MEIALISTNFYLNTKFLLLEVFIVHNSMLFTEIILSSIFVSTLIFAQNGIILTSQGVADIWNEEMMQLLILIATSILAVFLFVISFLAYRKNRRRRLLFVTAAFFLFAVKGVLMGFNEFLEVLYHQELLIESIAQLLDFGILALFFLGLIKARE